MYVLELDGQDGERSHAERRNQGRASGRIASSGLEKEEQQRQSLHERRQAHECQSSSAGLSRVTPTEPINFSGLGRA